MAGFSLLFRLLAGIRPWMYGTGGKEGGNQCDTNPISLTGEEKENALFPQCY